MKKKIFSLLALLITVATGVWAQDADNCPNAGQQQNRAAKARAAANISTEAVFSFDCTSGYQYGVVSDGEYIYASSWSSSSSSMFYKYDMNGNFIEEFNISSCGYCRDMTFDGTYVYGVANGSTIYQLDMKNKTLVGTISTDMSMRCVSYDRKRDGFWVAGNWSGPLAFYDRNGNQVQTGIYTSSVSGIGYFEDNSGEEHILQLDNGSNYVHDYNITTNEVQYNILNLYEMPGFNNGTTGGCFIGVYEGEICMYADMQQSPNRIAIYPLPDAVGEGFSLTKAKDAEAHGTIVFKVDGKEADKATEGKTVTVEVTPEEYYVVDKAGGQWFAAIAATPGLARSQQVDLLGMIDMKPVEGKENTWEFTMQRANAEVDFTYKKSAESPDITSVEILGEELVYDGKSQKPTIIVKDGDTELTEGTDYTITYVGVEPTSYGPSSVPPTNAGTYKAIITFTESSDYIGTKEVVFTIERGEAVFTAPTPVPGLVFNGTEQELITPGTAPLGGSLFYALGISPVTSAYSAAIPAMTDAGMYYVNYKLFGDDNVNSSGAGGFYVTIAPKAAEDVNLSVVVNEDKTVTVKDGDLVLRPDLDYDIMLKDKDGNPVDIATALANDGTYQVILTLKGNYSGTLTAEIVIENGTGIKVVVGLQSTVGTWYDLNGRRLQAAPTTKGVYIVNGRKVVIN